MLTGGKAAARGAGGPSSVEVSFQQPATVAAQRLREIPFLGGLDGATLDAADASLRPRRRLSFAGRPMMGPEQLG